MRLSSDSSKVDLAAAFSDNLALRQNADKLFDEMICSSKSEKVVLDFNRVETMSRSFAHQYLQRKNKCPKEIVEQGLSTDITKMLEIAKSPKIRQHPIDFSRMNVVTL